MKEQIWSNKVDWLKIVYPHIITWASSLDYDIPSVSTLAKYTVKFLDCTAYDSVYNGEKISAIGTHYGTEKRIKIAGLRDHMELMTTLIHEFAHAVQLFSLGEKFHIKYKIESSTKEHCDNKFEDEARALEARLLRWHKRDSFFREELDEFIFEFVKPKPKPEPKPEPKPKPVKSLWDTFTERDYVPYRRTYEPDWYEKSFSKKWWDRSSVANWGNGNGLKRRSHKRR